jgi:SNF2 family DNA or RNA helicase
MLKAPCPWVPEPYHVETVKFLLGHAHAGVFLDPGLGKTACVLAMMTVLRAQSMVKRLLVVAPKRVARNVWPDEQRKWIDFAGIPVTVLHGPKKDKLLDALPNANAPGHVADIVVVTFEGLDWLAKDDYHRFKQLGADVLIVDESTYIKNTRTLRFKNLKPMLHLFKRRVCLTGTPRPNGYEDLFGQMFVVDMGGALGRYITHFRMAYFDNHGTTDMPDWHLRPGCGAVIDDKIRPMVLRGDKDELLRGMLPKELHNTIEITLPQDAREQYDRFEKDFYLALAGGEEIESPHVAALGNKLRQIANGFAYTSSGAVTEFHTEKMDALAELIESLNGKPAFVLYEFVADIARLERAMGVPLGSLPVLRSTLSELEERRLIAAFNAGQLPVLLAHPQAAGHGLNLQESAGHVVWIGPTWNLEHYDQAVQRVIRRGNPNAHVTIHTLVARDTKDEDVAHVLRSKDRAQTAFLQAMKRRAA